MSRDQQVRIASRLREVLYLLHPRQGLRYTSLRRDVHRQSGEPSEPRRAPGRLPVQRQDERNQRDDTFGFGVVFSDETLDNLMDYDRQSYAAITKEFSYWDEIDFHFHDSVVRSTGHGFCGTERRSLLMILQDRCAELRRIVLDCLSTSGRHQIARHRGRQRDVVVVHRDGCSRYRTPWRR